MYSRNRIYVTPAEQKRIHNFHILLAGAGLGSVIAECALRLGFNHITIIDGDVVEKSNLNRQNYTVDDIGKPKAEALKNRLLSINPHAKINAHHCYLDYDNIPHFVSNVNVAINAIDFDSDIPFVFDYMCESLNIPALHPYNLGWGACVFVVTDKSKNLSHISHNPQDFELKFASYVVEHLTAQGNDMQHFNQCMQAYKNEEQKLPPPQLAVASWIAAGLCADILFRLAIGKQVKLFPDFYFKTL
ncbi:MAG: ThiF family adenylyltransferase [Bacteroidales bacterium]|jgi:molybdopterin/thiamine biosynthesis adenylyltransferase|nr:ThiF family adenylyltransferase [Bacteroidales bacterium]